MRAPSAIAFVLLACWCPCAPAQQEDVLETIATAESALKAKKHEDAALLLRRAALEADAIASDALRARLRSTIEELLKNADPLCAQRKKAEGEGARALVGVADAYTKTKWHLTALDLLKLAGTFDAETVKAPLAAALVAAAPELQKRRGLPAEPDEPASNQALVEWFKGGRQPWDALPWRIELDAVESPHLAGETTMLMSIKELPAKARVSVQVSIGDRPGHVALAFGMKSVNSYCILSLHHTPKDSACSVQRYSAGPFERLHAQTTKFSPEAKAGWQTLAFECNGPELKVRFGAGEWVAVKSPVRDFSGALGLMISGDSANKEPVRFRNLKVEILP